MRACPTSTRPRSHGDAGFDRGSDQWPAQRGFLVVRSSCPERFDHGVVAAWRTLAVTTDDGPFDCYLLAQAQRHYRREITARARARPSDAGNPRIGRTIRRSDHGRCISRGRQHRRNGEVLDNLADGIGYRSPGRREQLAGDCRIRRRFGHGRLADERTPQGRMRAEIARRMTRAPRTLRSSSLRLQH